MINDVLDLSKVEAGRMELDPTAFDLHLMLGEVGRLFEERAESAGLRFSLEIDPGLARYIKSDAVKLRQILINLLGNAVKFTREGSFTLRARSVPISDESGMVTLQLEVEDSGPGITTAQLERIFEPFVQVGQVGDTAKGSGLGLTITKSYVDLLGGEIGVESAPRQWRVVPHRPPPRFSECCGCRHRRSRQIGSTWVGLRSAGVAYPGGRGQ